MFRAIRIGIFIGTLLGMSACAATDMQSSRGPYGGADAGSAQR